MAYAIQNANNKEGAKALRSKAERFDFEKFSKKEINELIKNMRDIMRKAQGVGLAANQIGLKYSVFVAEVPASDGGSKFYAAFNPSLSKYGGKTEILEEGCLSVPGIFGQVERSERVVLDFEDKSGKPQKIKAWGLLARVFQHEVDHLNGKLILDKAKKIIKETQPN